MDAGEASLSTEAAARLTYKQVKTTKLKISIISFRLKETRKKLQPILQARKLNQLLALAWASVEWGTNNFPISEINSRLRTVTHDSDFQEIRQVEASTTFKEPSIMDDESMGSFSRRKEETDDLADLYAERKVTQNFWFVVGEFY